MELVYNQLGTRQYLMHRIMVASPHVRTRNGDMLFYGIGQALQVTDHPLVRSCLGATRRRCGGKHNSDSGVGEP
jgi:hypothetical protein